MTSDSDKARAFYASLLGWDYDIQSEEFGGYAMCRVGDDTVAGIGRKPADSEMPDAWTVYLLVDDLQAVLARWTEHGGQIVMPAMEVPRQGHMAMAADPSGAVVGLWQPIGHHGFDILGPPGSSCWYEVNTRTSEQVRDFFTSVFELTAQRMPDMHYYTLHEVVGPPRFGVLQMTDDWGEMPAHWMVYFAVDDVPAAVERVEAGGGQVMHGPFDTPQGPIAVCLDPTGTAFSIVKPLSTEPGA